MNWLGLWTFCTGNKTTIPSFCILNKEEPPERKPKHTPTLLNMPIQTYPSLRIIIWTEW